VEDKDLAFSNSLRAKIRTYGVFSESYVMYELASRCLVKFFELICKNPARPSSPTAQGKIVQTAR
jgi:hypothetical protein